jgi:hypothetical protein
MVCIHVFYRDIGTCTSFVLWQSMLEKKFEKHRSKCMLITFNYYVHDKYVAWNAYQLFPGFFKYPEDNKIPPKLW